jgi:hypothetical protein
VNGRFRLRRRRSIRKGSWPGIPAAADSNHEGHSEKGVGSMAHETILIIDDNADMRLLLSLRLKA